MGRLVGRIGHNRFNLGERFRHLVVYLIKRHDVMDIAGGEHRL